MSDWPSFILLLACSILLNTVSGNWDESTGHILNYKPSDSWFSNNRPQVCSTDIQVAECARNTRLHYPNVQVFATFEVNHKYDGNHGCPLGTCCAYTTLPYPSDLEVAFTDWHCFFWHERGGYSKPSGPGVNLIADPQTGVFGYENSHGHFVRGQPATRLEQPGHDSHYPGFHLPPAWGPINFPPSVTDQPDQPKCGRANDENHDPGQSVKSWKIYVPAPASAYLAPTPLSFSRNGLYNAAPDSSYLSRPRSRFSSHGPYRHTPASRYLPSARLEFPKRLRSRQQRKY